MYTVVPQLVVGKSRAVLDVRRLQDRGLRGAHMTSVPLCFVNTDMPQKRCSLLMKCEDSVDVRGDHVVPSTC